MSNSGGASFRAVAGAAIASAARVAILALALSAAAMLFAPRAQASLATGGATAPSEMERLAQPAASAVGAHSGSPGVNAAAIVGAAPAVADHVSSTGGSSPAPASGGEPSGGPPNGGAPVPVTPAPAEPAPSEPAAQPESEEGSLASGSSQTQGPSSTQAGAPADSSAAKQPESRTGLVGAIATASALRAAGGARHEVAATAATAPDRERQAEAALRVWSWSAWREGAQLSAFAPDLQRFIAEFRSLARDITPNIAGGTAYLTTGAAAQEIALVLTDANAPSPSVSAAGSLAKTRFQSSATLDALLSARQLSGARLSAVGRDTQKTSVATPTASSPTVAPWLPSAAGAAFGSGATGAAAPAAALLAVAAVCLLGTWLARRLADDGLAWKSALLNLRLERPG